LALAAALAAAAAGCQDELPPLAGTTSLAIDLISPTDFGDVDDRLPESARDVTLSITALDIDGEVDPSLTGTISLYLHFLGSLSPSLDSSQVLQDVAMTEGRTGEFSMELPIAYGPTVIWAEHSLGDAPTWATGTSPTLWYRDAYLADVSRPVNESALDALERSPLEAKQVNITASRYGAAGRMMVVATYAQGYCITDVACQDEDGTPPCTAGDYDSVYVYTHSRPESEDNHILRAGQVVDRLTGAVSEFNGLTEVGFPQSFVGDDTAHTDMLPAPAVIDSAWLSSKIELERVESGLVAIDDATVCELDDDWTTYSQWKLDIGLGCGQPINVITKGQVPDFDPAEHVGEVLPRVVGTLRPVNIAPFHVWIVYPRDAGDLTLP
jgi:hypothetical protein